MADEGESLIEQKLASLGLEQSPEEFVEGLPAPIKRRVELLQELQKTKDAMEVDFRKEKAALEAKYELLYGPLYKERAEIVIGTKVVPPKEGEPAGEDVTGIPEFWVTVLLKNDVTAEIVKDKDLEVLNYLRDIQAESIFDEEKAPGGFKLVFTFAENPFFSNTVLEKTYHMLAEEDGVLEKAEGSKIEWKSGKDVTVKIMKKKPKKGGKPDGKPQIKTEKIDSFFNFFSPPDVPGEDDEIDEEAMEELQGLIEADYEIGATIREKIIPEAVSWYTGEAIEDEPYYFGDEDDEGFDEGDEDEDEDEDEDDAPPPKGHPRGGKPKGGQAAAAGGKAGEQPPECKQQ